MCAVKEQGSNVDFTFWNCKLRAKRSKANGFSKKATKLKLNDVFWMICSNRVFMADPTASAYPAVQTHSPEQMLHINFPHQT